MDIVIQIFRHIDFQAFEVRISNKLMCGYHFEGTSRYYIAIILDHTDE